MIIDINCPYCDATFQYNLDNRFNRYDLYVQPSILPQYTKLFWKTISPEYVFSEQHKCNNCSKKFNYVIFANDINYINYLKQSWLWKGYFFYYDILIGQRNHLKKKSIFEMSFNSIFHIWNNTSWQNIIGYLFIIYLIISSILYIYSTNNTEPYYLTNTISSLIILITSIISVLLLGYFFNYFRNLDCHKLRFNLTERYQQTNSYLLFEEVSIKGCIFGPQGMLQLSLPTIIGLLSIPYIISSDATFLDVVTHIPENLFIMFYLGILLLYFIIIIMLLFIQIFTYKIKINTLIKTGGVEAYGEIFLKSNYAIIVYFCGVILTIPINAYILKQINYQTIIPILSLISYMSVVFLIVVFFGVGLIVLIIHGFMKEEKEHELRRIDEEIISHNITSDYLYSIRSRIIDEELILLFNAHYKISDMNEWPLKTDIYNTIWNIFTLVILPLIAIAITIIISLKPPG